MKINFPIHILEMSITSFLFKKFKLFTSEHKYQNGSVSPIALGLKEFYFFGSSAVDHKEGIKLYLSFSSSYYIFKN